jgi:hypothetical protein
MVLKFTPTPSLPPCRSPDMSHAHLVKNDSENPHNPS